MSTSLLDALNREKEIVDEINDYDRVLKELEERRKQIESQKRSADLRLKSIRSVLAAYVEKNLIKLPNHDPYKHPEVQK